MSKAAVKIAGRSLAHDLAERGISVFLLHLSMVATEMTGRQGTPLEEAAPDLVARVDALDPEQSGAFWHGKDESLAW